MSKSVSNKCIAVRKVATPLRELTCYMGSHSVTCHPAEDIPTLTPAEAGTRFSYPEGMQGWVDLVGWLHTEMVYPPEDGHPSQYLPGPTWVNFFHATNAANHYTTPPTNSALLSEKNQNQLYPSFRYNTSLWQTDGQSDRHTTTAYTSLE